MNRPFIVVLSAVGVTLVVAMFLYYGGFFNPHSVPTGNGQLIYTRGVDEAGVAVEFSGGPPWMGMMGGSCLSCHGSDGRGGYYPMMCDIITPDIRYSALTAEGFTNSTIRRAIMEGFDESGESLDMCMPRWSMSLTDLDDLVGYLVQLG